VFHKLKYYSKVNWVKTLYFNFKMFPFSVAIKLPVFFYGHVKFSNLSGTIILDVPTIERGMIGFGQPYEMITTSAKTAELTLAGNLIFRGHCFFGKDYRIFIKEKATLEFGHMCTLGNSVKMFCTQEIRLANYVQTGIDCLFTDTVFHPMINTKTKEVYPMTGSVCIGNYNFIGFRTTIMKNTTTPNYCTIASNSLCNTDYTALGTNILIGGIPAKLLKENITRDWDTEKNLLDQWLKLKNFL